MKKVIFTSIFLLAITAVIGHEFWIQPEKYFVAVGARLPFNLFVGENFKGEKWSKRTERTEELLHVYDNDDDFTPRDITQMTLINDTDDVAVQIKKEGTQLLYLHSYPSFIALDAEKFNAYLKEDGIDNILKFRTEKNELNKPAREKYERFAKTFIQCGKVYTDVHTVQLGGKLELFLNDNPYTLKAGAPLEAMVHFNQQPLADKMVVFWQKDAKGNFMGKQTYYTDGAGKITLKQTTPGIWMMSTVHMEPVNDPEYEYHSYWGSVTFEISK